MRPVERFLEKLLANGHELRKRGTSWSAQCPAHDDQRASLSISEGDDGRVLVKCHAGCTHDAVCKAIGLTVSDLFPTADMLPLPRPFHTKRPATNAKPQITAEYDYHDEGGNLVCQVVRYEPKDFRQRRPKPDGGWDWSVKGLRVVPYRLSELLAEPAQPVVVVEGEKDADKLAGVGVLATCNAGGAGKWTAEHSEFLRGRRVIIVPDNDEAGRNHAEQVAQYLHGVANSVRIVDLPGLPPKGDVTDWIEAGGTKGELHRLLVPVPSGSQPL